MLAILISLAAAEATPSADPLDKVRCEREEVIGSLVQTRKVCHTLREWQVIRRNVETETRRLIQDGQRMNQPG